MANEFIDDEFVIEDEFEEEFNDLDGELGDGENVIEDDYEDEYHNPTPEPEESHEEPTNEGPDLTQKVLNLIGIADASKIKFQDESGSIYERSWNDLTEDELIEILTSANKDPETDLDDAEIDLINAIRASGKTPTEFINNMRQEVIDQIQNENQKFQVDDMDDDYLFILNKLDTIGSENVTDEELNEMLEQAKSNETLYQKTVAGLRAQYKQKEMELAHLREENDRQVAAQQYEEFQNTVLDEIQSLNNSNESPFEMDSDDLEDLADFILTRDSTGFSKFGSRVNNPGQLVRTAYWSFFGPKLVQEALAQSKNAFQRGYEAGKATKAEKPGIVVDKHRKVNSSRQSDEEEYFDQY